MPWKNGGGETIEIAVHPVATGLDDIFWRVSMAAMTADGPFSVFPGFDRTLVVVQGDGVALIIGRENPVRLTTTSDPLRFPADVACAARLLGSPVTNLNVMTRRSRFRHLVRRLALREPTVLIAETTTLVVCCTGTVAAGDRVLERHDVLVVSGREILQIASCDPGASVVLITLLPIDRLDWPPMAHAMDA
jgi:environmental stress-induced protein Ves